MGGRAQWRPDEGDRSTSRPRLSRGLGLTRTRALASAVVLGLLLAGCAGSSDEQAAPDALAVSAVEDDRAAEAEAEAAAVAAQAAQDRAAAEAALQQAEADRAAAEKAKAELAAQQAAAERAAAEAAAAAETARLAAERAAADKAAAAAAAQVQTLAAPPPAARGGGGTDPRFGTCKEALANGYGGYRQGTDPEYDWYRDADDDGVVCE